MEWFKIEQFWCINWLIWTCPLQGHFGGGIYFFVIRVSHKKLLFRISQKSPMVWVDWLVYVCKEDMQMVVSSCYLAQWG